MEIVGMPALRDIRGFAAVSLSEFCFNGGRFIAA
jgi:hypothetical protein